MEIQKDRGYLVFMGDGEGGGKGRKCVTNGILSVVLYRVSTSEAFLLAGWGTRRAERGMAHSKVKLSYCNIFSTVTIPSQRYACRGDGRGERRLMGDRARRGKRRHTRGTEYHHITARAFSEADMNGIRIASSPSLRHLCAFLKQ